MSESLIDQVRERYAGIARSGLSGDHPGVAAVAQAFGYAPEELARLPAEAHMGLSCGNPTATAHLRPGEVVVDLGCGGGIDVLLAARQVGPTGKAVGIDMTPEMVDRARSGADRIDAKNAEFRLARMEAIPLADETVDCVISNCVINLAADKSAVFREMYRVLKPGGRVAVSDIALKHPLPDELARSVASYVGCLAGALPVADYERMLREAGFEAVQVVDARKDLNAYASVANGSGCCGSGEADPKLPAEIADLFDRHDANEHAASVRVFAVKPATSETTAPGTRETTMPTLQVFDRPMCCATGVCGASVDPVLPRFASDLDWLRDRGVVVERFNLAHDPAAFVGDAEVKSLLQSEDVACLPLFRIDGNIVHRGKYPSRSMLARWCGVESTPAAALAGRDSDGDEGSRCC